MRDAPGSDAVAGVPAFAALGVLVREAGGADSVSGVPARFVAAPSSSAETGEVLAAAAAAGLSVVARGAGTKLDWGDVPRSADLIVDTGRLDAVVEHAAGDLVVVVQAGVRLSALATVLAAAGQRLAVDPPLDGTVGGLIATGVTGPRRLLHGGVRDLVLGATLVRADGVVTRSGGKVVKNVAGYDLAKLACGSYGTLGLVTEAAFRLHPIPAAAAYVAVRTADPHRCVQAALHGQFVPTAIELDRPAGGPATVAVLIEGTATGVKARTGQLLGALGPAAEVVDEPAWWGWLPAGDVLMRVTCAPGRLGVLLAAVDRPGVAVRGSAGAGSLWATMPADPAAVAEFLTAVRAAGGATGPADAAAGGAARPAGAAGDPNSGAADAAGTAGTAVLLAAPPQVRAAVDAWGPVPGLDLMRRVKESFDPGGRLSPGRFVGGI